MNLLDTIKDRIQALREKATQKRREAAIAEASAEAMDNAAEDLMLAIERADKNP